MNKENKLSLLETNDMTIVSFEELADILGGADNQDKSENDDKK